MKKTTAKVVVCLVVLLMSGLFLLGLFMNGLYGKNVVSEVDFTYTVESGNATITDYTGEANTLIIPEILRGYAVTRIGDFAFANSSLSMIEIPDSVTSIGDWAFYDGKKLTTIKIPNSVTSIGNGAFAGCKSLTTIEISKNNAVYSFIDGVLFDKTLNMLHTYLASNIKISYSIPDYITKIGYGAFAWSRRLSTLEIPDSVTSIEEQAFAYSASLTTLKIPYSVTSIGEQAFAYSASLTTLKIPYSVTSIGDFAFEGCTNLTLTINDKDSYLHTYAINNDIVHVDKLNVSLLN